MKNSTNGSTTADARPFDLLPRWFRYVITLASVMLVFICAAVVWLFVIGIPASWMSPAATTAATTTLNPSTRHIDWSAVDAIADSIAALSAIAVAAFAFRGLRSLRITRDEIVHRAGREAKLCAIQRLEEIANELVALNTVVLDGLARDKVAVFLRPNQAAVFNPDPTDLRLAKAWHASLSQDTYNNLANVLNRLEAWSVYFTEGVADAKVAFGPAAPLLRSWVAQYYAVLLLLRSGSINVSGNFPNLIKLYTAWSAQMDAQQLARQHKDVEGQMQQAHARLSQAQLPAVVPTIDG